MTTTPDTDHKTELDGERLEFVSAEAMMALLVALGVQAETINTGGNCWSSSITLTAFVRLELSDWPGEARSWLVYQHGGEQVMGGHWGTADDELAANKAKALIDALGSIVV